MKSGRRMTSFTLAMAEQVLWYTHRQPQRTKTSPGHTPISLLSTMSLCVPHPTHHHRPSQFCGAVDGTQHSWSHWAELTQLHPSLFRSMVWYPGNTFDLVNPSHIICACHFIPNFNLGRTHTLLDPSIAQDTKGDWCTFYANRYSSDI
jgi:hypothetical protein